MLRFKILATMAMLSSFTVACSDTTPVDQPTHPASGNGGGGGAGARPSDASGGSAGLTDAAQEASAACPQGAFRYDGGPCQCQSSLPDMCPGSVNGVAMQVCVDAKT